MTSPAVLDSFDSRSRSNVVHPSEIVNRQATIVAI